MKRGEKYIKKLDFFGELLLPITSITFPKQIYTFDFICIFTIGISDKIATLS